VHASYITPKRDVWCVTRFLYILGKSDISSTVQDRDIVAREH